MPETDDLSSLMPERYPLPSLREHGGEEFWLVIDGGVASVESRNGEPMPNALAPELAANVAKLRAYGKKRLVMRAKP